MRKKGAFREKQSAQGVRNLYRFHRKSLSRRNTKGVGKKLYTVGVKLLTVIVTMQLFYSKVTSV
tara:strand:- start:13484 stop:13675 length:192 start_codon:yes stop_codon:yes gene_type:complete